MQLQQASRKNAKIKMAIQGPSGSGKTYGALLVAYGLTSNWQKIAVIDTENHSSELYAHLGRFQVLHLDAPFTPERYVEAIKICQKAGMEVVIIDSISHEWEGIGGILETHSNMTGNSYTNWSKLTPRHNSFVQHILQSPLHIIGTIRSRQQYVLSEKNGKQVPEKVGMKGVTREGMDYEFTLVFEVDMKNNAVATKDRTSLFIGKPEVKLTPLVGNIILDWCAQGSPALDMSGRINDCKSLDELLRLFYATEPTDDYTIQLFTTKRKEFETADKKTLLTSKSSMNGTLTTK